MKKRIYQERNNNLWITNYAKAQLADEVMSAIYQFGGIYLSCPHWEPGHVALMLRNHSRAAALYADITPNHEAVLRLLGMISAPLFTTVHPLTSPTALVFYERWRANLDKTEEYLVCECEDVVNANHSVTASEVGIWEEYMRFVWGDELPGADDLMLRMAAAVDVTLMGDMINNSQLHARTALTPCEARESLHSMVNDFQPDVVILPVNWHDLQDRPRLTEVTPFMTSLPPVTNRHGKEVKFYHHKLLKGPALGTRLESNMIFCPFVPLTPQTANGMDEPCVQFAYGKKLCREGSKGIACVFPR